MIMNLLDLDKSHVHVRLLQSYLKPSGRRKRKRIILIDARASEAIRKNIYIYIIS